MKQFVEQNTQRIKKQKRIKKWAIACAIAGFLMIWGSVGTEDIRNEMTPEQAKKELPSTKQTYGAIGAGLALLLGGALLTHKANQNLQR